MKPLSLLLLSLSFLVPGAGWAQQDHADDNESQVIRVMAHEPRVVAKTAVTYHATCPQGEYRLHIDRAGQRLTLDVAGGKRQQDFSHTSFGAAFLQRPLYGNFGMSCGLERLRVFFQGFELRAGSQPRPVTFSADLRDDGRIDDGVGLQDSDLDFVNLLAR